MRETIARLAREEEEAVRRDVAADLDDDLGVAPERDRARISVPAPTADPGADLPAEAGEAARGQRLAPDVEHVAERGPCCRDVLDDAGRRRRAHRVRTPRSGSDPRRQQERASLREELDVGELPLPVHAPTREARVTGRPRREPVLRAEADRRRDRRRDEHARKPPLHRHSVPVSFRRVAHHDLGGFGDGMQVLRDGDALYVGHFGPSGMGTSVLDVSEPHAPRLVTQLPAPRGTHTHKVQVADGLLLVNEEQFRGGEGHVAGLVVYDVADDPLRPQRIGRLETGGLGVHRIVWTGGRYAHASATPDGFGDRIWIVVDLADPEHPVEAARWWLDETQPAGRRYAAHHALVDG